MHYITIDSLTTEIMNSVLIWQNSVGYAFEQLFQMLSGEKQSLHLKTIAFTSKVAIF